MIRQNRKLAEVQTEMMVEILSSGCVHGWELQQLRKLMMPMFEAVYATEGEDLNAKCLKGYQLLTRNECDEK